VLYIIPSVLYLGLYLLHKRRLAKETALAG